MGLDVHRYTDWIHFKLLLWPVTFSPDWRMCVPLVESTSDPAAWVAILFFLCLALRAGHCITTATARTEAVAWTWLILPFVPASNLFFYVGFTVAERVTYTPSLGFCMLLGLIAAKGYDRFQSRVPAWTLLVAVCGIYIQITMRRDLEWGNERLLWQGAVTQCPKNFVSHVLLGNVHDKEKDYDSALSSFRESLVHNPAYMIAHLNIGRILRQKGDFEGARDALQLARRSCDTCVCLLFFVLPCFGFVHLRDAPCSNPSDAVLCACKPRLGVMTVSCMMTPSPSLLPNGQA